jgi:phytoene synthase
MQTEIEQCGALLRGGSHTFHAASLVFPRRYREPAFAVYAFCRIADDAIDSSRDPVPALATLRERLDGIYRGRPHPVPADRAFAAVVERFGIPRTLPDALLEGFRWDAENRRYETLDDLVAYAVRVAGTVGGMMALLMGRRDPAVLARAMELGVAMQLSNIARDVGEDARAGRLYLPLCWLREEGIDPDRFVTDPAASEALSRVVQRLLENAERMYRRAEAGIPFLPVSCRPAIAAARVLYAEIGKQVERNGFDAISQRAVVSTRRKLSCAARAIATAFALPRDAVAPSLAEAQFLIDAVVAQNPLRSASPAEDQGVAWWRLGARAVWVLELFNQLERRQQPEQASS